MKGRKNFRVAVRGMRVEKKIGQRAFHAARRGRDTGESRAGDLRGALEIQDAGAFRNFPVRTRREIEFRRSAPAAHLDVGGGVMSHRHRTVRQVRHRQHEIRELRVQDGDAFVGELDFVGDALHFRQQSGGILARLLAARNFLAGLVALGLQAFGGGNSLAAFLIERAKAVEIDRDAAIRRHLLEFVQVLAKISQVHACGKNTLRNVKLTVNS